MKFPSLSRSLALAGCGLLLTIAAAQAQAPPGGGPQPGGTPADVTPIDGGASLLLASGAAYALKRLRKRRA